MAGVISRETGCIVEMPTFTPEARSRMLDAIIASYLDKHPNAIRDAIAALEQGGAKHE